MTQPVATRFHCIDAHTCGNPVRLVYRGGPPLDGDSMLDRQQHFVAEYDWIRTALMYEPRGHAMMSGSILYPSNRADCDIGVLFIETSGCLPMCGHGTIGTVTIAVENRLVVPRTRGPARPGNPGGARLGDLPRGARQGAFGAPDQRAVLSALQRTGN